MQEQKTHQYWEAETLANVNYNLFIGGHDNEPSLIEELKEGFDEYFVKPLEGFSFTGNPTQERTNNKLIYLVNFLTLCCKHAEEDEDFLGWIKTKYNEINTHINKQPSFISKLTEDNNKLYRNLSLFVISFSISVVMLYLFINNDYENKYRECKQVESDKKLTNSFNLNCVQNYVFPELVLQIWTIFACTATVGYAYRSFSLFKDNFNNKVRNDNEIQKVFRGFSKALSETETVIAEKRVLVRGGPHT